jgi:hypothetical protein
LPVTEDAILRELRADLMARVSPPAQQEAGLRADGDLAATCEELAVVRFGAAARSRGDAGAASARQQGHRT